MNVHKNAKLTPAGRAELVKRVLFEKETVREVSRASRLSERTVRKRRGRGAIVVHAPKIALAEGASGTPVLTSTSSALS